MPLISLLELSLTVSLEVAVAFLVLRQPSRRFLYVLLLCFIEILAQLSSNLVYYYLHPAMRIYRVAFFAGDLIAHLFIFLLIGSLILLVRGSDSKRQWLFFTMLAGVGSVATWVFLALHHPELTRGLSTLTRNFSFAEEILNLLLWAVLLQKRDLDAQVLIVSAGIGIQVTGEVIGHTLRSYSSPETAWVPTTLVFVCEILRLLMWVWAFRIRPGSGNPEALEAV